MKTIITSFALVALCFGTVRAADNRGVAGQAGKMIQEKEPDGRKSMMIEKTKKSALMVSANDNGGRDDLNIWRFVRKTSKVKTPYVRPATPWVKDRVIAEMTSELNRMFRRQNGTFAPSDFQKITRTRNKAGKLVSALKFRQTTQNGKTGRVGYVYMSRSKKGYLATKMVDYKNGRRVSRYNRTKYRIKSFK